MASSVTTFLASVPPDLLAAAASRCGAHARALQTYEAHCRAVNGGGLNPAAFRSNVEYTEEQVGGGGAGGGGGGRRCAARRGSSLVHAGSRVGK